LSSGPVKCVLCTTHHSYRPIRNSSLENQSFLFRLCPKWVPTSYCPYEQTHIGCMEDGRGTRNKNEAERQRWMSAGEKRHSTRDYSVVNYILLNICSNIKKRSDEVSIPWSFLRHGFTGQRRRVASKSSLDKRLKVEASSRSNKELWALHEGSSGEGIQS